MSNIRGNILITGASRGIGNALVHDLLNRDEVKRIFAGCRNPPHAYNLKKFESSEKLKIVKLMVQDDESINAAFDEIQNYSNGEGLNILINTAAIFEEEGGCHDHPNRQVFLKHFDVNSTSPVILTNRFMPLLQKAAKIDESALVMNLSSSLGSNRLAREGFEENVVYGMSKAALNNYTTVISRIYKDAQIIVVSIDPGPIYKDVAGSGLHPELSIEESARDLVNTLSNLNLEDTGKFMDRFGAVIPF